MLNQTTDKAEIKRVMHDHMLRPDEQVAPFLVEIMTREFRKGGTTFEGARPIAACVNCETGEVTYTLSNGDSNYNLSIGTVKLSEIEYISTLKRR